MSVSKEFIDEYGQEAFDEIFECDSDNSPTKNVTIIDRYSTDMHGLQKYGTMLYKGTVFVYYENGINNGSVILNFDDKGFYFGINKSLRRQITINRLLIE